MVGFREKVLIVFGAVLTFAIGACLFINSFTPSGSQPTFDYTLNVTPFNGTIMQGQNIETNITVSHLQGKPQPVTITVTCNSTVANFYFSKSTGTPKPDEPFTSNLTLAVLGNAESATYTISINTNTSDNRAHSSAYNVTVLNRPIQVYGWVKTISEESIYPTKLQFVSIQTNRTYNATLTYPKASAPYTLIQRANYTVSLPNQQSYKVTGTWTRLFGPWIKPTDLPNGTFDCGILTIDCKAEEDTIKKNYHD
jgi:hypothetical protein